MTSEEFYEHVNAGDFTDEVFRYWAKEWHPFIYLPPKGKWAEEEIFDNLKSGRWRIEYDPQPPPISPRYGCSPPRGDWSVYIEGCEGF